MCAGSPIPPSGTCASKIGSSRGSISSCVIGVRIQPGAIAFTRMPEPLTSCATLRVIPMIPAFAAE